MAQAANAPFRNALRNICGMNAPAANAIISQGFTTPSDLVPLSESDIDTLVKHTIKAHVAQANQPALSIPYNSVVKLKAF